MVLAPIVRGRKGEYGKQLEELRAEGFSRVKVDGELRRLDEEIVLDKKYKHDIAVVVDRLVMKADLRKRLADSVETAVALADGLVEIELVAAERSPGEIQHATSREVRLPGPRAVAWSSSSRAIFSFNSPHGACPRCTGLGSQMEIDPELVVPGPGAVDRRGGDRAVGGERLGLLRPARPGDRRALRRRPRDAVGRSCPRTRATSSCTARTASGSRSSYRNRFGRQRSYPTQLRGDRAQPGAPLPGDRLRVLPGEDRGVHDPAAVPRVQGRAAASRVPGGAGGRHGDPRVHRAVGPAGARRGSRELELSEHDQRIARLVLREIEERLRFLENVGRRLPVAGARARRRCPAARRSGSGWRPRSAPRSSGCSTSSTSRRSVCTSATTRS